MPDQRVASNLLAMRLGEGDERVGALPVVFAPQRSTGPHFIAFSGVTLVSSVAASSRYGRSSRASGSTAAPK